MKASREFRRIEELPDPFGLTVADTAASALQGRLAFVAVSDPVAAAILADRLADRLPGDTRTIRSDLFAAGLEYPWSAFTLPSDVGLSQLLTPAEFLTLLRRLADDLLLPAVTPGDSLVDVSTAHANHVSVWAMRSLFPDALIVVDAATASRLPAWTRESVLVAEGEELTGPLDGPVPKAVSAGSPDGDELSDPMRDRLIVVVGCGRSGTTWLQELLLAHPRVAGQPRHESWLFHQLRRLWANHARPDATAQWLDEATFVAALRRYCDGVFARARHRSGHPANDFYVEKTPTHIDRLTEIAAVYPDAWVVHLVRDGRAVARSMVDVPFFEVPDLAAAASVWARGVTAVRAAQPSVPRFRDLRYEDLRADAAGQMRGVWQWLGVEALTERDQQLRAAISTPVSAHRSRGGAVAGGTDQPDLAPVYRNAGTVLRREGYVSRAELWRAKLSASRSR